MSRVDRLELVVSQLAKRILGEDVTFDQIAEKEAAAQGVAYVPPTAAPAPDLDPLLDRIAALEQRPASVPPAFPDLTPVLEAISHLSKRIADLEARPVSITMEPDERIPELEAKCATLAKHLIEQEASMQRVMQAASDLDRWVNFILDNGLGKDGELRKAG